VKKGESELTCHVFDDGIGRSAVVEPHGVANLEEGREGGREGGRGEHINRAGHFNT
jgi:hypothetical protein